MDDDPDYDPSDRQLAMQKLMEHQGLVTGIIYQNKEQPSYESVIKGFKEEPLAKQDLKISEQEFEELVAEFA